MFQRKQTLFLLFAVSLNILFSVLPFATFNSPDGLVSFSSFGVKEAPDSFIISDSGRGVLYLSMFGVIFGLLAVFLFKKYALQTRLCLYALTSNLLLFVFSSFFIYTINKVEDLYWIPIQSYPLILPLVNLFLLAAAFRGIRKDKELLESYSRIR
jgi:hypothetical protein